MGTSISNLIGLNGKSPPAVFWRKTANQYMTYIGFHLARKGKSKGLRLRTPHYLGRDQREANLNAILIDRRWDKVVLEAKQRAVIFGQIIEERQRVLPVWPTEEQRQRNESSPDELEEMGALVYLPPGAEDEPQSAYLSVAGLRDKFLAAQKERIGLKGRRGLKPGTCRQLETNLERALKGIDVNLNVLQLKREDCRRLVDYWLSPDRNVVERTASSYCKTFLCMMNWADNEEICGFHKPKVNDLFIFTKAGAVIQKFDPERMKRLLGAATERCRLYILLGLNTGYTQIDIANLRRDQIFETNGDVFLIRKREKTSHQNDFKTQHYLWPETWELLWKNLAPENVENLALLNVNGRKLKRGKSDNIRDSMDEVRDTSGIREMTFKQLRKFGVSAIKRITTNPEIARKYAAHQIHGVLSDYDRDDFFDPLTDALKKWREELIRQGVL